MAILRKHPDELPETALQKALPRQARETGAGAQNQEASSLRKAPRQATASHWGLWIVMATAAALGITALLLTRKTRRSE